MEGTNSVAMTTTLSTAIRKRFLDLVADPSINFVGDILAENYMRVFNGEMVHVMIRKGSHMYVFYAKPHEARWLFDAYGETI